MNIKEEDVGSDLILQKMNMRGDEGDQEEEEEDI